MIVLLLALWLALFAEASPGDQYVLSPKSRTVIPKSVYQTSGGVEIVGGGNASPASSFVLSGPNSSVTYDFGQQVAGIPSLIVSDATCLGLSCDTTLLPAQECLFPCQGLGLAYSESAQFVGQESDKSTIYSLADGTVFLPLSDGLYTVPSKWARGSFRYLTFSFGSEIATTTRATIKFDSLYFNAAPNIKNDSSLGIYTSYFESSDGFLNKIFYAGLYTLQLCQIQGNSSVNHAYVLEGGGWAENSAAATLTGADTMFVDGAKRDRNPWSGDLAVALRSALVSQNYNNLIAIRNLLDQQYTIQQKDTLSSYYGYLPYAGSPLGNIFIEFGNLIDTPPYGSDTYNLWTLLDSVEYIIASNDTAWGSSRWSDLLLSIGATYQFVDADTGLFNGTRDLDWGRIGQGGSNSALNALYYHTLQSLAAIAPKISSGSHANVVKWTKMATKIKSSMNSILFDTKSGMFYDNTTAAGQQLYPSDGNTLAILFNITTNRQQAKIIANNIISRFTPQGLLSPELPGGISPFIASLTLRALMIAQPENIINAMNLLRTQWGFMLDTFSQSTFIEGYASNGTLDYPFYPDGAAFVSHAHAWSTGPVYSLLANIVGLQATLLDEGMQQGTWQFRPLVVGSGITSVSGGYTTHTGNYSASWNLTSHKFSANLATPNGVSGAVYLPSFGRQAKSLNLSIDGHKLSSFEVVDTFVVLDDIDGGSHTFLLEF